nr:hypothetical protein [uncultured Marinifilum sp.]
MNKFLKIFLNIWFLIFSGTTLFAIPNQIQKDSLIYDNGQLTIYKKDNPKEKIESYRHLKEFNYDLSEPESQNIFERILIMIKKWISFISKSLGVIWYLRYILIGGLIIFLIVIIAKSNSSGLFRPNQKIIPLKFTDNIDPNTIKWEEEINKAIQNKEFRLAVRYQFLASLKKLSTLNFIHWKSEKTNSDYILEINNQAIKSEFTNLSKLYEAVWYGNFPIAQEDYKIIGDDFNRFNSMFHKDSK